MLDLRNEIIYETTVTIKLDIKVVTDGNLSNEQIKQQVRKIISEEVAGNISPVVDDWIISNVKVDED